MKKVLSGIKPYNDMSLKSCYYNQMVAGYSLFGVPSYVIASNYFPLYCFDKTNKYLSVKDIAIFNDKELYQLTGVEVKTMKEVGNLVEFLISEIDKGSPILVPVDCFYLNYRNDMYKRNHIIHYILVYGYDTVSKKYYTNEHYYYNSFEYSEILVDFCIVEEANKGYMKYLRKSDGANIVVLSKKNNGCLNFEKKYKECLKSKRKEIECSFKNFKECIMFLLKCLSDEVLCKENVDNILEFLGNIKYLKIAQTKIIGIIIKNDAFKEIIDRIVEDYIFLYGVFAKIKFTADYSKKIIEKAVVRCNEIEELEKKLHEVMLKGLWEGNM